MKKISVILLAILMLAFGLSGCQTADTVDPPDLIVAYYTAMFSGDAAAAYELYDPSAQAIIDANRNGEPFESAESGFTDISVTINRYERIMTYTAAADIQSQFDELGITMVKQPEQVIKSALVVTINSTYNGTAADQAVNFTAWFTFLDGEWHILEIQLPEEG